MKVKMLLKSGFGAIRCGEVFDVTPDDARLGFQVGFLAPIDADAMVRASREPPRTDGREGRKGVVVGLSTYNLRYPLFCVFSAFRQFGQG